MDPNFGVLVGIKPDACGDSLSPQKSSNNINLAVVIAVPVAAVFVIVSAILIYFYRPKIQSWMKIKKSKKTVGLKDSENEDVTIEKRGDMELNSVAGRFTIQLWIMKYNKL